MATEIEIANYFSECSRDYQRFWTDSRNLAMHYGFWNPNTRNLYEAFANLNRKLVDEARITKGDMIMDAGCGLGGSAIWLAKNLDTTVVGINICKKDVETCTRSAKKQKVDHLVKFYHGDMKNTGFKQNSFDVIWAIESIVHIDDKKKFFEEAFTLLKKNGRIIIADGFLSCERNNLSSKDRTILKDIETGWAITIQPAEIYLSHLRDSGFGSIRFMEVTENIMKSSWHIYIRGLFLLPVAYLFRGVRLRTDRSVYNSIACKRQYDMFRKGYWCYGIVSAVK